MKTPITCLSIITILCIFYFSACEKDDTSSIPTEGLVVYYPFNGNANDESGNEHNGTIKGPILNTDRFGTVNGAYLFDGINDLIEVANSASLHPESVSVSCWILRKGNGNGLFDGIVSKYNGGANGYLVGMEDQGHVSFWIRNAAGDSNSRHVFSNSLVQNNIWLHIVGTFQNGEMKIYINGQIQSEIVNDAVLEENTLPLTIGSYDISYFNGLIDDVRIYNRALSDPEVQLLYHERGW